jgi:type I restriction enzyme M protein
VPLQFADIPGWCKSAPLDDFRGHNYFLTPGRYVGAAEIEDGGEPFEEKMARLTAELKKQMEEGAKLDKQIWHNLKEIGYGR